ncbi:hypothetical protein EW145_g2791 [Phellinidium pouzarii]|uniref:Transcription activator of gluconeogenesis ERT1 n=1 Tax=Phellinidium pouzarii TaxID=167371 RepID=A0A4S4L9Y2_9AGAM|nr:hypothetical protein EW145_g2791 [Phellinidium pouzarii]
MHTGPYPPLRPVEPRPPILPSPTQTSSSDGYRLNSSSSATPAPNAEAGPSSSASGMPHPSIKQRDSPKKKKAARACFHCQKAHLTCDDTRPCQRCVKRGMAEKCTEGHRKKAKYLLEDSEREAMKDGKSVEPSESEGPQPPAAAQPVDAFPPNDLYFNLPLDQTYSFGSEAANLEYSSLSAILGLNNYSPDQPFLTSETPPASGAAAYGQQFASAGWPADPQQQQANIAPQALIGGQTGGFDANYADTQQQQQNGVPYNYQGQVLYENGNAASHISIQRNGREQQQLAVQRVAQENAYDDQELAYPNQQTYARTNPPIVPSAQQQRIASSQSAASALGARTSNTSAASLVSPPSSDSSISTTSHIDGNSHVASQAFTTQDFYATITKPYSYIESYAFLMKFLYKRFNKNDILRVIRALSIYRPSMIALQAPMTEEDYVFMEKCLRRSLVELEKLISYSGTPTVVWRRTGEICLVGVEFCLLTEWKKEDLMSGRKYIYELFESQSVIEYWEKFASHAFENTTQSVFSHCVLMKPSGEPIPCTFCFSIRRDIFDLPSVVIGQWLPLM